MSIFQVCFLENYYRDDLQFIKIFKITKNNKANQFSYIKLTVSKVMTNIPNLLLTTYE